MYQVHYEFLGHGQNGPDIEEAINDTLRLNPTWEPLCVENVSGHTYVWFKESIPEKKGARNGGRQSKTRAPQVSKKR